MSGQPALPEGTRIRFPEGNDVVYGQDFRMKEGLPSDREFTVARFHPRNEGKPARVYLEAPGYGGEPYGNGKVFLTLKEWNDD